MTRKSLALVAAGACLAVAAFAASGEVQKSTITVGDFAVKVTGAIGQPVTERSAAVESLRSRGVRIGDVNATLTEGMAARILADLGLRASTSSPNSAVTSGKVDQLVTTIGLYHKSDDDGFGTDPPVQCLATGDKKECKQCCYAAASCDPTKGKDRDKDCTKECDKFCKGIKDQPPSPSKPL